MLTAATIKDLKISQKKVDDRIVFSTMMNDFIYVIGYLDVYTADWRWHFYGLSRLLGVSELQLEIAVPHYTTYCQVGLAMARRFARQRRS